MSQTIILSFTNTSLNPSKCSIKLHPYIGLDNFLLKLNEYVYGVNMGSFSRDSLMEFLSPFGKLDFSSTFKEEDVNIIINIKAKDIRFHKEIEFSEEDAKYEVLPENEEETIAPKTDYQLFLDNVNEFRMSSSLLAIQVDKITNQFYKIFVNCEFFMFNYFDDYPEITRLEVYNAIQDAVVNHKEWLYNAISFMEQYVDAIKKNFPKRNEKIFLHVPISEENTAREKGAIYDESELLFYYTNEDDAYLFGRWLPIQLNQYSAGNENLNGMNSEEETVETNL